MRKQKIIRLYGWCEMNSKWILGFKVAGVALCAVIFIALTIIIYFYREEPIGIDRGFRDFCYQIRGKKYGFLYWFFKFFTEFGNFTFILILLLGIAIVTKLDFRFFLLVFGLMLSVIINVGLKDLYSRERPYEELRWANEFTTSFPSGHSTAAGFLYTFLIYLVYHTDYKKWLKRVLYTVFGLLIILVMFSRTILGVHYLTDVIAGLATGIMVSCFCMVLYRYCANNHILTTGLLKRKKKE